MKYITEEQKKELYKLIYSDDNLYKYDNLRDSKGRVYIQVYYYDCFGDLIGIKQYMTFESLKQL